MWIKTINAISNLSKVTVNSFWFSFLITIKKHIVHISSHKPCTKARLACCRKDITCDPTSTVGATTCLNLQQPHCLIVEWTPSLMELWWEPPPTSCVLQVFRDNTNLSFLLGCKVLFLSYYLGLWGKGVVSVWPSSPWWELLLHS